MRGINFAIALAFAGMTLLSRASTFAAWGQARSI
jgi:hypothetical protein